MFTGIAKCDFWVQISEVVCTLNLKRYAHYQINRALESFTVARHQSILLLLFIYSNWVCTRWQWVAEPHELSLQPRTSQLQLSLPSRGNICMDFSSSPFLV